MDDDSEELSGCRELQKNDFEIGVQDFILKNMHKRCIINDADILSKKFDRTSLCSSVG